MTSLLLIVGVGAVATGLAMSAGAFTNRRAARQRSETEAVAAEEAAQGSGRERFAARARSDGVLAAGRALLLVEPWAGRRDRATARQQAATERSERACEAQERHESTLRASRLPSSTVTSLVAALFWCAAVVLVWQLESRLIFAQGYGWGLSMAIATGAVIVNEVLGLVSFALLGVHPVPLLSALRGRKRIAAGGVVLTSMALLLFMGVIPLAASRANQEIGPEVNGRRVQLAELNATGASGSEIASAELAAGDAENRLESAIRIDTMYSVALVLVVFALSWAPIHGVGQIHLQVGMTRKRLAAREQRAAEAASQAFDNEFRTHVAQLLDESGLDPNLVDVLSVPAADSAPPDTASETVIDLRDPPRPNPSTFPTDDLASDTDPFNLFPRNSR